MNLSNGFLTALYKVLNIEEAVRPVGPRDILLFGKRNAWADYYSMYLYISMNTVSGLNSFG